MCECVCVLKSRKCRLAVDRCVCVRELMGRNGVRRQRNKSADYFPDVASRSSERVGERGGLCGDRLLVGVGLGSFHNLLHEML